MSENNNLDGSFLFSGDKKKYGNNVKIALQNIQVILIIIKHFKAQELTHILAAGAKPISASSYLSDYCSLNLIFHLQCTVALIFYIYAYIYSGFPPSHFLSLFFRLVTFFIK